MRTSCSPSSPPGGPPSGLATRSAEHPQKGRAGADQEPKVIPATAPRQVVDRKRLPDAKEVQDQEDPGRNAVPGAPEEVLPPHR
jgi:hypothetical protein